MGGGTFKRPFGEGSLGVEAVQLIVHDFPADLHVSIVAGVSRR
jgi:hypothetical protein